MMGPVSSRRYRLPTAGQQGVALVVGLILLLVLTLIGLTSMRSAVMEERMAGHFRDRDLALQAAEAALRDAEAFIVGNAITEGSGGVYNGSNGLLGRTDEEPDYLSMIWDDSNSRFRSFPRVSQNPRYVIKMLDKTTSGGQTITIFRITARGVGRNPNTRVFVQSTYQRTGN